MKYLVNILALLVMLGSASADERYWCLDEASSGYIMDPRRPVGDDKSKPQSFFRTHTAMRLSGDKVFLNFQGLGEKEHICSAVKDDVIQCIGTLTVFAFDKASHRFNLAQLSGHVGGSVESLVLRFGVCKVSP